MLGILVVLGEEAQPGRRAELHQVQEIRFRVGLVADDIDLPDFGCIAFHDVEHDAHAVALQLSHFGCNRHTVFAARHILKLQILNGFFQCAFIEDTRLGKTCKFHIVFELVFGKILDAINLYAGNGRALAHQHDQHTLFDFEADIFEKPRPVQGMDRSLCLFVIHRVADLDRQIAEHRARLGALYAFNAYVLDGKRRDRPSLRHE